MVGRNSEIVLELRERSGILEFVDNQKIKWIISYHPNGLTIDRKGSNGNNKCDFKLNRS